MVKRVIQHEAKPSVCMALETTPQVLYYTYSTSFSALSILLYCVGGKEPNPDMNTEVIKVIKENMPMH